MKSVVLVSEPSDLAAKHAIASVLRGAEERRGLPTKRARRDDTEVKRLATPARHTNDRHACGESFHTGPSECREAEGMRAGVEKIRGRDGRRPDRIAISEAADRRWTRSSDGVHRADEVRRAADAIMIQVNRSSERDDKLGVVGDLDPGRLETSVAAENVGEDVHGAPLHAVAERRPEARCRLCARQEFRRERDVFTPTRRHDHAWSDIASSLVRKILGQLVESRVQPMNAFRARMFRHVGNPCLDGRSHFASASAAALKQLRRHTESVRVFPRPPWP